MRINHRFDSRARLSTVGAGDLLRRYAFAQFRVSVANVATLAPTALPNIGEEDSDSQRLLARLDLTVEAPDFATIGIGFDFEGGGTLSLSGSGPTYDLLLTDRSRNTHPDNNPGTRTVIYTIRGLMITEQVERIGDEITLRKTHNRPLPFPQPLVFTRQITDYFDNP